MVHQHYEQIYFLKPQLANLKVKKEVGNTETSKSTQNSNRERQKHDKKGKDGRRISKTLNIEG